MSVQETTRWTPPPAKTRMSADMFVEADCEVDARTIASFPGQAVVGLGNITLYGTTTTLEATLVAALDAVRALVAEGAA